MSKLHTRHNLSIIFSVKYMAYLRPKSSKFQPNIFNLLSSRHVACNKRKISFVNERMRGVHDGVDIISRGVFVHRGGVEVLAAPQSSSSTGAIMSGEKTCARSRKRKLFKSN